MGSIYFDEAIRLKYLISPPISENRQEIKESFSISGEAHDDLGNQYIFSGGAYGLLEFAPCTDGVLSFSPLPIKDAESLTFLIEVRNGDNIGSIDFTVSLEAYES